jgi:hypothetical protein
MLTARQLQSVPVRCILRSVAGVENGNPGLICSFESSDHRFHQYSCGYEREYFILGKKACFSLRATASSDAVLYSG